ncbi:MAG: hypothetical protein WD873_07060 [Candidatus Hydrogenedentales bacterium]
MAIKNPPGYTLRDEPALREAVHRAVQATPITDLHTHLFPPAFGGLLLWGIDDLLTYHYLIAEVLRVAPIAPAAFHHLSQAEQADLIWEQLFVQRAPISEACRGVITVLSKLGLEPAANNLDDYRDWFRAQRVEDFVDRIFEIANVRSVVMTNDPFDDHERAVWERGYTSDSRFYAALRIDPLLNDWPNAAKRLAAWGYKVDDNLTDKTRGEVRRFLGDWMQRMDARYCAVSLPPDFAFPDDTPRTLLIRECVLPAAREHDIPFAMMIGVRRQINPALRLAGDAVGMADLAALYRICAEHPDNRFLCTVLSRENQHELAVAARKFPNLTIFGCWWFLNNPSLIEEMTRMRVELLGLSFIPQHSDARILDQLLYKWAHSRDVLARVLADKFADVARAGRPVAQTEIERDVARLLDTNAREVLGK